MFTIKKIDKHKLMTEAWAFAKGYAFSLGGKAYQYISDGLKKAWKELKSMIDYTGIKVSDIPAWIIKKNLSFDEQYVVLNECNSVEVAYQTEKAVLVKFDTDYGIVKMWCPKSVIGK